MADIVTIYGKKYRKEKVSKGHLCGGCAFNISPNFCGIDRYNKHFDDCANDDIIFVAQPNN